MKQIVHTTRTHIRRLTYLFTIVLFWSASWVPVQALSTNANFTLSPQSDTYTTGQEFTVSVVVSLNNYYNAVWSDVYFDNNRFQYLGTTPGSAFNGDGSATVKSNGFGSYVSISDTRTTGGSLYGSYVLATMRFKATSTGGTYLNFGSRRVVLYPTTEYTTSATNSTYSVQSPPAPTPTPTPTPAPTPTPTPTPAPTPTPTPRKPAPTATAPPTSPPSSSGLQITDFAISGLSYTSAKLTWKTNKPATTKANFSTTKSDLYIERGNEDLVTDHALELDSDTLEAGQRYFVRITSNDGSGPVTIDGEFDTKYIPVTVKVTGKADEPVSEATVTIDDAIGITDEDGEATFDLTNGEVLIYASKGDQEADISADIEIPESDDAPIQKVTLSLLSGATSTKEAAPTEGSSGAWRLILAFVILILSGGAIAFVFLRRRIATGSTSDPLEAESYAPKTAPPTLPAQQPVVHQKHDTSDPKLVTPPEQHLSHHASIAEMVANQTVNQTSSSPQLPQSPTGQQVPHHTSLKDMVKVPEQQEDTTADIDIPANDLPISPEHHASSRGNTTDGLDDDADQLTIHH
ncbi:hypothetical protein KC973_00420 [Candidatus Saccharibacteria bacterium]|nr:hypothetical protein [Candidatus Saccharibacteria bacterium]